MDYIHATNPSALSLSQPGGLDDVLPAQFEEKFWRQLAQIMVQLASIRLPQIGSITRDESGSFVVGPRVDTNSGPYSSASEFYADYPLALDKSLGEGSARGQTEVVQAFRAIAQSFEAQDSQSGFGLAIYDLKSTNVLVDETFNIVAIVDWGTVFTVPDAALHFVPWMLSLDPIDPGKVEASSSQLEDRPRCQQFTAVVEAVAREKNGHDRPILTQRGFFSKEAVAFRSLGLLRGGQDWVNDDWLQALRWLQEHSEAELAEFYLAPETTISVNDETRFGTSRYDSME